MNPNVEPRAPLEPTDESEWNESQFAFWLDAARGSCGFVRLAHQPNTGTQHRWVGVSTPSGTRFRVSADNLEHDASDRAERRYRGGGLTVRYDDGERMNVEFRDARCDLDLAFQDLHEPVDKMRVTSGDADHAVAITGGGHVEAAARVTGSIRMGAEDIDVDGYGHRDHAWGPRSLGGLLTSRWVIGTTPAGTSFSALKVLLTDGSQFSSGYVRDSNGIAPVVDLSITTHVREDGITLAGGQAHLHLSSGATTVVTVQKVVDAIMFGAGSWRGVDAACEVLVDGVPGVADFETSLPAVQDLAEPPLLGVCTIDGMSNR